MGYAASSISGDKSKMSGNPKIYLQTGLKAGFHWCISKCLSRQSQTQLDVGN